MKFAVLVLACVVACTSAQFNRASSFASFNDRNRNQLRYQPSRVVPVTPAPYRPVAITPAPYRPVAAVAKVLIPDARNADILKYGNEINPDGSYNYFFETQNGIAAQEQGVLRNFGGNPPVASNVAQGSYSWTSPEGQVVSVNYVADENGYQPEGNVIPTSPPVPALIARALEYIARNSRN